MKPKPKNKRITLKVGDYFIGTLNTHGIPLAKEIALCRLVHMNPLDPERDFRSLTRGSNGSSGSAAPTLKLSNRGLVESNKYARLDQLNDHGGDPPHPFTAADVHALGLPADQLKKDYGAVYTII